MRRTTREPAKKRFVLLHILVKLLACTCRFTEIVRADSAASEVRAVVRSI